MNGIGSLVHIIIILGLELQYWLSAVCTYMHGMLFPNNNYYYHYYLLLYIKNVETSWNWFRDGCLWLLKILSQQERFIEVQSRCK